MSHWVWLSSLYISQSIRQRKWMTAELGSMIHLLCPIEKEVLFIAEQRHWYLDQAMHSQSYVHPYWLSFWFTETHLSKLEIKLWRTKVFLLWNNISQSPRTVLARSKNSGNICWMLLTRIVDALGRWLGI